MPEKTPSHFLRRLFGTAEPAAPQLPEPVASGPAPIADAENFETARLQLIWRLFEAKRGERAMLSRADIDPGELKASLPSVGLIDVQHDPLRFRIRLAGTNWRNELGFEPTGMWLDDWPHATQKRLFAESWGAATERRKAVRTRRHAVIDGVTFVYEGMVVPLSADGETVNMLFTITEPWRTDAEPATVIGIPGRPA